MRLFDEVVNARRVDRVGDFYAPEFIDRCPGPDQAPGPAGIRKVVEAYVALIPDLHIDVDDVIVAGDRIATRETWTGTHTNDLPGAPATGKAFSLIRMHVFRLADGRIVEEWSAGSVVEALRS